MPPPHCWGGLAERHRPDSHARDSLGDHGADVDPPDKSIETLYAASLPV